MSMLDDAKAKAAAPYKAIQGASPAKAEEIDSLVANGKITALAGAMAKLRFIGPQSLTPAQRALVQMPSDNALGSTVNTSGVLGAATAAQKPTPQGNAAAAGISAIGQPGGGAMETTMPSTGLAKPQGAAGKTNAAAGAAMGAKAPPTLASGKVAANGGGVSGGVENDNPWSNGEAAQATGEILDNTPGVGVITKPNYAKNYAGKASFGAKPETTGLTLPQETAFRAWASQNGIKDIDNPQAAYDYRGFWLSTNGAPHPPGSEMHFPDTFKQHDHPTFSVESKYSKGPTDGGSWNGDQFVAPAPLSVGTPGQPMPTSGAPVKVPSLGTIADANGPTAKQLDPALDLPAPDNTEKAAKKQALVSRRQALTAELAQIEQQLATMGAA